MSFSLNEVEALCRKAARGAGMTWGLAEEAGRAVRWLQAHGIAGAAALADLLQAQDGRDLAGMTPGTHGVWKAPAGVLCPIITGTAICDRAQGFAQGQALTLGPTRAPILLAPFAAMVSAVLNSPVRLRWDGVDCLCTADSFASKGDTGTAQTDRIEMAPTDQTPTATTTRTRADIPPGVYHRLSTFAARTYAPATEASRIAGAGAGLTDND